MSRLSSATSADWSLDSVEHLLLHGVSWELYEHLLKVASNRRLHLTYDNGDLEIVSPLPEHEVAKSAIGLMIHAMMESLDLPHVSWGSTTFKRRLKKKGLEPDDCFYIASQPRLAGRKRSSRAPLPPPDLAIEIDITSGSIPRLPIYAALGVKEIWRYDGKRLSCLRLEKNGYREAEFSLAFPKLRVSDLRPFIRIAEEKNDQTAMLKAFRAWLAKP